MRIQVIWIELLLFCCCAAYFSAPRSESGFGSKRLLNSFSTLDINFKITEYNDDLSLKMTHTIQRPDSSGWSGVQSCDQYYLALSTPYSESSVNLLLISLPNNNFGSDLTQTSIRLNVTEQLQFHIAVSPSGRNFMFFNGTHLIVFEIEPKLLNWTIIAEEPISAYTYLIEGFAMSDSTIGFYFNISSVASYNFKTKTIVIKDLSTNQSPLRSIDTYNNYWLYTTNFFAFLEYPNGDIQRFNFSDWVGDVGIILPSQLSITKDYIDIAISTVSGQIVTLGTLNTNTHLVEQYNFVPSKSLGLLYKDNVADSTHGNLLHFGVGHRVLMYQLPNQYKQVALAVPSLPGNHSCSMGFSNRLGVFWCSGFNRNPTDPCPSGTYQPSTGFTTCLLCPDGTYQPNEGSIECMPCKENEYCPLGSIRPEIVSNSSRQVTWDFPITESAAPSFEEILLMLLFASSITSTSISVVLLGCAIITAILLLSLLAKHSWGVNLHWWLAKIDIHKKTNYKIKVKPSGASKIEAVKVESVFGGYLTLLAVFILLVGLITTIIYVNDYHPLLVGQDDASPSQNSIRTSSLQDYNTQSKASELANIIKDNLQLDITFTVYNFQTFDGELIKSLSVKNCYDQYGNDCTSSYQFSTDQDNQTATYYLQLRGSIQFSEAQVTLTLGQAVSFTWATVKITSLFGETNEAKFQTSTAKYLVLPGENKVLTGLLLVPVTMTIVVRETEHKEEFDHSGYMSYIADESKLRNMGHSAEEFALTNDPVTFQLLLQLDNNWRLESEQQRFSGVGAFFAALLAILGLYEVTLLASELAHRVFHSIEKRRKKRSKYEALEDPPLIVNEKSE